MNRKTHELLAKEIYELLLKNGMWQDVRIYFNGKALSTDDGNRHFRYGGEPFVLENVNPRNFFEYAAPPATHILSMSFEGPLYAALNNGEPNWNVHTQLVKLFEKYGFYFEQGNAWNLTAYK